MKSLLKLALICATINTAIVSCTTKEDFEAFANEWVSTYVQSSNGHPLVSPAELNILLNLTYFSYKRSAGTITAQDCALQALNENWRLLQNIKQTRLDPSHSIPYKLEPKKYDNLMKQTWLGLQEHEYIDATYTNMIEFIFYDQNISNQLHNSIKIMRDQARAALIDSLAAIKTYIESLIEECQKRNTTDPDSTEIKKGIVDYLIEMIPPLAARSFVAVDSMGIEASEEGWKVLAEIERIHNLIWLVLEQRRANFYAIMYRSLYEIAKKCKAGKSVFMVSFDDEGQIPANSQSAVLPDPRKIKLFE